MNIDAPNLIVSAVLPASMALCLILIARRQGSMFTLCCVFLLGGLASFVFTHVLNRMLSPLEAIAAGPPGSICAAAASAFITAALSEELARLLTSIATFRVLRNLARVELTFVCAMIGLGFAMFENAICALTLASAAEVVIQRTIPTMSHGAVAMIMGSYLQHAVTADRRTSISAFIPALLIPLILHGLYDFGAFLVEVIEIPGQAGAPTRRMRYPSLQCWGPCCLESPSCSSNGSGPAASPSVPGKRPVCKEPTGTAFPIWIKKEKKWGLQGVVRRYGCSSSRLHFHFAVVVPEAFSCWTGGFVPSCQVL